MLENKRLTQKTTKKRDRLIKAPAFHMVGQEGGQVQSLIKLMNTSTQLSLWESTEQSTGGGSSLRTDRTQH